MQGGGERLVALLDPRVHLPGLCRVEVDDGAAPVLGVLAPPDESGVLEVAGETARGGQRQPESGRDLPDRPPRVACNQGEDRQVTRAEPRLHAERVVAPAEPTHHPSQQAAQLGQLRIACHMIKVTER